MEIAIADRIGVLGNTEEAQFAFATDAPYLDHLTPFLRADFVLRLVNHSRNQKERVVGVHLLLKKRTWRIWRKTLIDAPVMRSEQHGLKGSLLTDIAVDALEVVEVECVAMDKIDQSVAAAVPRESVIWIALDLVGPRKRMQRRIEDLRRVDKSSTDSPRLSAV